MSSPSAAKSDALTPALDPTKLPKHIAIIMDGNGRWAEASGMPRIAGHKAGVDSVRDIVKACGELGIKVLTLYAFSTENWLRPAGEITELMRILGWVLEHEVTELNKNNVKLMASGRIDALPKPVVTQLNKAIDRLKGNSGLILNLALNYGARQEIVDAVNSALAAGAKTIDEKTISQHLYTADLPDPDLVIRTSGEMRISNFLLWQIAYAELYITPVFWPDFRKKDLIAAIADYQKRNRRFGGI